jgi:hypothetical protein
MVFVQGLAEEFPDEMGIEIRSRVGLALSAIKQGLASL